MRISLILTGLIGTAMLFTVTACNETSTPLKGTVVGKEHEKAEYGLKTVDITQERCTKSLKGKRTCTTIKTGKTTQKPYPKKAECYELDIKVTGSDETIEVCNQDAYYALNIGDPYDSSKDYTEVTP